MAALLPDFEYDIFISYRHNDKEWVADFVKRLKITLSSVIKENNKLNIYYDADPKDGLGDTHQVKASLDHRVMNSLILLPVISLTYCDTTKYSWGSEFLPFLESAKANRLGLELQVQGGKSVASRVLPLQIHNLKLDDTKLLEQALGGHIRSIGFVHPSEEVGVNRPLEAEENIGYYRDQISKVANAINDLLEAAKAAQSSLPTPNATALASAVAPTAATPAIPRPVASTAAPVLPAAPAIIPQPAPTGPVVFLAWTSNNLKSRREELALICTKAGLNVVANTDCPTDEATFQSRTQEALASADCVLHLLGNKFGDRLDSEDECSYSKYAYEQARQQAEKKPGFRQFVWYTPDETARIDPDQKTFVDAIRNEQTERCTFSSALNAPELVQEMRTALVPVVAPPAITDKEGDICFIYNDVDSEEAEAITDQLSEAFMVESITIKPDSAEPYKDRAVSIIPKSRLAVVYFKHSGDWALPFLKQVYQLVGGAKSPTSILLMGEDDPKHNHQHKVKAQKVIWSIQPHQSVSEEVQRVFQQLNTPV